MKHEYCPPTSFFSTTFPFSRFIRSTLALAILPTCLFSQSWQMVWSDEFEYQGQPDPNKWGYEVGYVRNAEAQYYTSDRRENARVESGCLVIESRRDWWQGHEYTSASLVTLGKASWTYGRWEIRAQLPGGRGTWPAIWTLGTNIGEVGWPACGEIDILENVGFDSTRVHANIHVDAYNHAAGTGKGHSILVSEPWNRFYTYAMEWYPDRIDFFVDDSLHWSFTNEGTGVAVWPFDAPQYLLCNVAIGGSWGGQQGIDTTIFPTQMRIEYVRIYQQSKPGPYSLTASVSGKGTVTKSPDYAEYDSLATVNLTATAQADYEFSGWYGDTVTTRNPLSLTMVRDRSLVARFIRPGDMLINGSFDEGMTGWHSWINSASTAQATLRVVDGVMTITITQTGTNTWDVHLNQPGLELLIGARYRITFDAWAQAPRTLGVGINKAYSPYSSYYSNTASLTTAPQTFSYEFTMSAASDNNCRIEFNSGDQPATVYIDNVSLVRTDSVPVTGRAATSATATESATVAWFDLAGRRVAAQTRESSAPGILMARDRTGRILTWLRK